MHRVPWRRVLLGAAVAIGVVAVVPPLRAAALDGASQAIFLAASPFSPDVSNFKNDAGGTKVVAADGSLLVQVEGRERRQPVELDKLPPQVRNAVLAAEDANFYHHPGVDAGALLRAAAHNVAGGGE